MGPECCVVEPCLGGVEDAAVGCVVEELQGDGGLVLADLVTEIDAEGGNEGVDAAVWDDGAAGGVDVFGGGNVDIEEV